MQTYDLRRSSKSRLKFHGEIIAEDSTPEVSGRYTKYTIYRTANGLVVAIMDVTLWENERNSYAAEFVADITDARQYLETHGGAKSGRGLSAVEDDLLDEAEQALDQLLGA